MSHLKIFFLRSLKKDFVALIEILVENIDELEFSSD